MKKIGFLGAFEKTDLILYVAKILIEMGKKTLVIDSTINQRARYIVPTIAPSKNYITEFEKIDVAIGFDNLEDIKNYLGTTNIEYDYILIDIDSHIIFDKFNMIKADKNYFVTAFDNYSLKRGLEIIGNMENIITMTKILFSREMLDEEDDYLNFLSFYYSVQWSNQKIYFPFDHGDNSVIIENQRASKIRFKNLSIEYKNGLLNIIEQIAQEIKPSEIRRAFKAMQ